MYVLIKNPSDPAEDYEYFRMLANNGVYVEADITKAIVFKTATIALKQCDVLNALDTDNTYVVREVTLTELQGGA